MPPSDARVPSVLVLFNTVALYGMERGVIEYFDLIRSEVRPHFLVSRSIEKLNLPVFQEIRRRGFDVSFFSDRYDWPKIGRPRSLRHLFALVAAMFRGNRDVLRASRGRDGVYAPSVSYLFFALIAMPWFRLTGRRVIYHFHDLGPHPRWLLRVAAFFITDVLHNTEEGRRQMLAAFPSLSRARQVVVPYPTERRDGTLPEAVLNALGGAVNVVYIGQVSRHKGVDLLIDAFIAAAGPQARLHVLGDAADHEFLRTLQQRARAAGVDVRWWGYVSEVHGVLERADLYVHPSPPSRFHESFGRGIAEAMQAGIPTVCFRSGMVAELVIHGDTGWVCERDDVASLAAALRALLADPVRRRAMGDAARLRYERAYSPAAVRRASEGWLATWKFKRGAA